MMMEVILYISLLSILATPITAFPGLSRYYLVPRNDFDPGYPADPKPEPAPPGLSSGYNLSVHTHI